MGKGVTSFYLTPMFLVKKKIIIKIKKTFRSIPSPLHRGCFFAGSQIAEKVERLHDPILPRSQTTLVPLQFFHFPFFPFFPFSPPPHRLINSHPPKRQQKNSPSLSLPSPSPPPPSPLSLPHRPSVRRSYFPLLSYQKRLLERIVCLSPIT